MGLGDLGNAVIILIVFMLLNLLIAISIGITSIKNNWEKYKCNPAVMPFAGVLGYDSTKNYNECIKNTQISFMDSFLDPIYGSLEIFASTSKSFLEVIEQLKLFSQSSESGSNNLFAGIQNKVSNVTNEISLMYITIKDTFANISSLIAVIFYMIQGGITTVETIFSKNITGTIIQVVQRVG